MYVRLHLETGTSFAKFRGTYRQKDGTTNLMFISMLSNRPCVTWIGENVTGLDELQMPIRAKSLQQIMKLDLLKLTLEIPHVPIQSLNYPYVCGRLYFMTNKIFEWVNLSHCTTQILNNPVSMFLLSRTDSFETFAFWGYVYRYRTFTVNMFTYVLPVISHQNLPFIVAL